MVLGQAGETISAVLRQQDYNIGKVPFEIEGL